MPKLSLDQVAKAVDGRISLTGCCPGSIFASGYSIDTRLISSGDIFFALKGERRDGHEFVKDACAKGAAAALVVEKVNGVPPEFPQIEVRSTLDALQRLASHVRDMFELPVIAISGSNGKTTTKEMLRRLLAGRMRVRSSPGNFNNQIGLPLSLLSLDENDEIAVVEVASNHRGEIKRLCEIARPDVGVITNVGKAHIGLLGSVEEIAKEKTDLARNLRPGGKAIINADDHVLTSALKGVKVDKVSFGIKNAADFRATDVKQIDGFGINFTVAGVPVRLKVPGVHNVYNAIAAIAASNGFGVPLAEASNILSSFESMRMKMTSHAGIVLIDDSYNANPDSVSAALEVLSGIRALRRVFVMGEMLELGDQAEAFHKEIGSLVHVHGIDLFVGVGGMMSKAVDQARASGMGTAALFFATKDEAKRYLGQTLKEDDAILVKGSRLTRMDEICDFLRQERIQGRK